LVESPLPVVRFIRIESWSRLMAALLTRMSMRPNFSALCEAGFDLLFAGYVHRDGERVGAFLLELGFERRQLLALRAQALPSRRSWTTSRRCRARCLATRRLPAPLGL
jgi:hypothetical protein